MYRPPPPTPDMVTDALHNQKSFTNKTDVPIVSALYATFFANVAPSIVNLNFCQVRWQADDLKTLCQTIWRLPNLRSLNITGNKDVGDPGAIHVASMLMSNSSIIEIDFRDCGITDEGAKALADALNENTACMRINLIGNNVRRALKDLGYQPSEIGAASSKSRILFWDMEW